MDLANTREQANPNSDLQPAALDTLWHLVHVVYSEKIYFKFINALSASYATYE